MRSSFPIAAAVALAVALGLVSAVAAAQTPQKAYKWQSQPDRFYQRGSDLPHYDPNAQTQRQLKRLGLQPNKPVAAAGTGGSPDAAAATGLLRRFDTDHNGSISESEYLGGRVPAGRIDRAGRARTEAARSRSIARFKAADRDRNGRLTPDELNDIRDRRF